MLPGTLWCLGRTASSEVSAGIYSHVQYEGWTQEEENGGENFDY